MLQLFLFLLVPAEVDLPGTQPQELNAPAEPTSACNCHLNFTTELTEPGQSYIASMMALSARDPLFRAALSVAARDKPALSDLCIRCHAPMGWLGGRSTPGDGTALQLNDLESVTCDVCHRMVPTSTTVGPQLIGDGQYTLSQETAKRARRGNGPDNGHRVVQSDFQGTSEMCGACHSLFNPTENAHDANGLNLGIPYYEQRTYEEWADSIFAARGETCIECHMKKVRGRAARGGSMEYDDLRLHAIVGGNDFIPQAVRMLDPFLPINEELPLILAAVQESLRSAATIEVTSTSTTSPIIVSGRDEFELSVKVTNKTGHKLPTGYPEGRRVYLEVSMILEGGEREAISGAWDPDTGNIVRDPQLRVYETNHARFENGASTRTHHLFQMNQIVLDTRIPPEGFTPRAMDMVPVGAGYDFGSAPPYRHWDETTYTITAPDVEGTKTGTITVRVRYQVTDGEVVDFLLAETGTSTEADRLRRAWEGLNRAPPRLIAEVNVPLVINERIEPPDAGFSDTGTSTTTTMIAGGGCSCSAMHTRGDGSFGLGLIGALLALSVLGRSKCMGRRSCRTR